MSKIKQFLRNASLKFHICVMIFCVVLVFLAVDIYVSVSHFMFYVLLALEMTIFIVDAYYAINRAADDYLEKFQKTCFNEIKTFLPNHYLQIYLFRNSEMDRALTYYGKINEDDTLSVCSESGGVKKELNEFNKNYMWFMKNFYTL